MHSEYRRWLWIIGVGGAFLAAACAPDPVTVSLITDSAMDAPAEHGITVLTEALTARGHKVRRVSTLEEAAGERIVIVGTAAGGPAAALLHDRNIPLPDSPEALVVYNTEAGGVPTVVLCGADARGTMYAALDAADRVGWSDDPRDPFRYLRDVREQPDIRERSLSIYTMQRAWFEQRLFDEDYWAAYFDMLARHRWNSFVVIFGYENGGFMAPPYPYFFDLEKFPDVELVGITPEQQQRHVAAFRRMIDQAHARGIDVIAGIWDHIYRGGVQGGGIPGASQVSLKPVPGLVWGVTAENLTAYNQAAITRFLEVFPDIDGLQFRMHNESGLRPAEMGDFWHEIFQMIRSKRPDLRVDIRAKELPDAIIDDGLRQGINLRVATKYWMEQMGMPFHPTHVNPQNQHDRRHGYADLLRYPRRYKVHWRMWSGGAARVLLWGDPVYARRFAESAHVYGGDSFELNEPLATKMLAQPHDREPFDLLNPQYRYYEYEFERYWHFFQTFGRLGYNPDTPPEVWQKEFQRRFGEAGVPVMQALHLASNVVPRIVAASYRYRYFPTTRGWAEKMRMDDLPVFATAEGSDVQQFMNFREEAQRRLNGDDTPKRRPQDTARWFAAQADTILQKVAEAEQRIGPDQNKEFHSTITDLKILGKLARYHARRIPAAVNYNLYTLNGDFFALDDAIRQETEATAAWQDLVDAAGDVYTDDLMMGIRHGGLSGHWREELDKLRAGIDSLTQQRAVARLDLAGKRVRIAHVPIRRLRPGEKWQVRATATAELNPVLLWCAYGTPGEPFRMIPMPRVAPWQFSVDMPPPEPGAQIYYYIFAEDAMRMRVTWPEKGISAPFKVLVSEDREPPAVTVHRGESPPPGSPLRITADVQDPAGLRRVTLRYRHMTQFEDYEILDMQPDGPDGRYTATIPGEFLVPEWDIIYFIEAVDNAGNGRMAPDLESGMPYVIVELDRK